MKIKVALMILLIGKMAYAGDLDSKSAEVTMSVAKYAKISELNNFVLLPVSEDGAAEAIYSGSDTFRLEANCPVTMSVAGGNLSNGRQELRTRYQIDQNGSTFISSDPMHDRQHSVDATAQLGNISEQEAGGYRANITITVSAL